MASSTAAARFVIPLLLMVLIQLGSLSLSVTARPCKTLLISSYSFSLRKELTSRQNPNPKSDVIYVNLPASDRSSSSPRLVTVFTTTAFPDVQLNREPAEIAARSSEPERPGDRKRDDILGFLDLSFLSDRTKDILNVAVALIFGVVCGALTAITMFLVWAVLSICGSHYLEESGDQSDFNSSPKKMGYVKIPAPNPSPVPTKA